MNGLFFTGTDTGVGKTVITAGVARLLCQQGHACRVCKPVATGANWIDGRWLSDDTAALAAATGQAYDEVTPWAFPEPAAPPVAARLAGATLQLAEIAAAVRRCEHADAALLVEGVGGLLCPLTEQETVADLVAALGMPLVVVARRSLGTLNHTLMTLEAAHSRGLPVAGVVISETTAPVGAAEATAVEELRRRIAAPILAVVPHQADVPAALAGVDWWALARMN